MKQPDQATIDAEQAIRQVVKSYKLEYAELSPIIREVLASVYIQGGIEAIKKIEQR